jgi:hypothetical protein
VAVGRATETVQHCKEYIVSAKDASFQQVRSVLKTKDAKDVKDASTGADNPEEEEAQPCSIDQAVETIERNTLASFPFGGFPAEPDECEDDLISVSGGGQVATA